MKCCQKKSFRLYLIVATDRSRSMHGREFHRRGRRLKYECLEALDVALECLNLRNVSWRVLDELKQTKLEIGNHKMRGLIFHTFNEKDDVTYFVEHHER